MAQALFSLGRTVATPGALETMREHRIDPASLLARHITLDPGSLDAHDRKANREALKNGDRIFSSFVIGEVKLWVITESDRSSTCILLPSEY